MDVHGQAVKRARGRFDSGDRLWVEYENARRSVMKPQEMSREVEELAEQELGQQPVGGMLRIDEYPVLRVLIPNCFSYEGSHWGAQRRTVDQLDQVTFWRLKRGN